MFRGIVMRKFLVTLLPRPFADWLRSLIRGQKWEKNPYLRDGAQQ